MREAGRVNPAKEEAFELANEIAHCPVMVQCLKGANLPCRDVVLAQWPKPWDDEEQTARRLYRWPLQHPLPVPWVGHIETSPLLFLSSNPAGGVVSADEPPYPPRPNERSPDVPERDPALYPSLRYPHAAPKWWWSHEGINDHFDNQFYLWVDEEHRSRSKPGDKRRPPTLFWKKAHERAVQLFNTEDVTPGRHYAMTELVHCRSSGEAGVSTRATKTCVDLYLARVLRLAREARTIVAYGKHANRVMRGLYPEPGRVTKPLEVEGLARRIVYLDHPAFRGTPTRELTREQVEDLQEWIASTPPSVWPSAEAPA